MSRIKKSAAVTVPQNIDQANAYIAEIGDAARKIRQIETNMAGHMALVKDEYETMALPWKERIDNLTNGLQSWCEANRNNLTQGGKVKTADLPAGKVGWRLRPPRCIVRGSEAVVAYLRKMGLGRFIRTLEEVNKDACLNEADIARQVPGITITQSEDFFVEPFDVELAEQ